MQKKRNPNDFIPSPAIKYPWLSPNVREDVQRPFNLRLSEPQRMKLKFIAENTPPSMQQFCLDVLDKAIEEKIYELTSGRFR